MRYQNPFQVKHLVAISFDSLWVQNESGKIYYNQNASQCELDCWREVPNIPDLPIVDPYYISVTNEPCAPLRPLSNVVEEISECREEMFRDFNYSFALQKNGNIFFWQATIHKEWATLKLFNLTLLGAAFLFIPTLLIALVMGILDWLFNRGRKADDDNLVAH